MRKIILLMTGITILLLANCCGYQSKTEILEGNQLLATFTQLDTDGKTVLTGVANPLSNHVIVAPAKYKNISADKYTISCTLENDLIDAFTEKGKKIGTFELFSSWNYNGEYYLGVKYMTKTYYFPQCELIVNAKNVISEQDVLFLESEDDNGWMLLNYIGEHLWQIQQDFLIIRNAKNLHQLYIAIEEGTKKPSCTLYTTNGEEYKKFTPKQWAKLKKATTATDNKLVVTLENFDAI